ncbi:uncharacterized protein EI90DRAFT_3016022 [Cantharellus anzutake]|uniref:uncharacterized protein n=1 Tax=Cantharellus anzutake TaxID=1750568 RepID=UPI001908BB42|nr:uncharacterized protein EI90DRAFT_3016022 [Cantharellus anzutake]KAF8331876.1 hypothetical protein EI90DRAFT_3016022 [Cantharellus anzutake]
MAQDTNLLDPLLQEAEARPYSQPSAVALTGSAQGSPDTNELSLDFASVPYSVLLRKALESGGAPFPVRNPGSAFVDVLGLIVSSSPSETTTCQLVASESVTFFAFKFEFFVQPLSTVTGDEPNASPSAPRPLLRFGMPTHGIGVSWEVTLCDISCLTPPPFRLLVESLWALRLDPKRAIPHSRRLEQPDMQLNAKGLPVINAQVEGGDDYHGFERRVGPEFKASVEAGCRHLQSQIKVPRSWTRMAVSYAHRCTVPVGRVQGMEQFSYVKGIHMWTATAAGDQDVK